MTTPRGEPDPASPLEILTRSAQERQHLRQWPQALEQWDAILSLAPGQVDALSNRATCLRQLGRMEEARAGFEAVLERAPVLVPVRFNYANLLQAMGLHDAAQSAYRRALEDDPAHVPSLVNLARMLRGADSAETEMLYRRAIQAAPDDPRAYRRLAQRLQAQKRAAEARPMFERSLALRPEDPELRSDFGVLLTTLGDEAGATEQWQQVLRQRPDDARALNNLGAQARKLKRSEQAIGYFERAIKLAPQDPSYAANLAQVLLEGGQISRATALIQPLMALHPDHAELNLVIGFALVHIARIEPAIERFMRSAASAPRDSVPLSNALFASLYRTGPDPESDLAFHRQIGSRIPIADGAAVAPLAPMPKIDNKRRGKKTKKARRVGFVSPDFRSHPVSCFIAPVFSHFRRERIETVCYSVTQVEDEVTEKIRGDCHQWRSCASMSDAELAAQIRADGCDVLVDLAGHTAQNRLAVFRARPAPLQLTYMGYPGTTGIPEMDGLIADHALIPDGVPTGCSERVIRLNRPWISYAPFIDAGPVAPTPCLQRGHVRFGSFNTYPKLCDRTVKLWSEVLLAVPGSDMLIRALGLADEEQRRALPQRFARHGVDPARILASPPVQGAQATFAAYGDIDIALDPLPFNGCTTTCDALWMGVPVLTLPGSSFRNRMGMAIQSALGESDGIASNETDFVERAKRLVADPDALSSRRADRRERMLRSPLGDAAGLADALSAAFEGALA